MVLHLCLGCVSFLNHSPEYPDFLPWHSQVNPLENQQKYGLSFCCVYGGWEEGTKRQRLWLDRQPAPLMQTHARHPSGLS